MKTFSDFDIDLGGRTGPEVCTTCPRCSGARRKANALCLSVNTDKGCWYCHHCHWRGSLHARVDHASQRKIVRPHFEPPSGVSPLVRDWFANRGIPESIVARYCIALETAYMPQVGQEVPCLVFPYFKQKQVVNMKYRSREGKHFRQVKDAEKILYGVDDLTEDWCVMVEGECDKLALAAAGISNAVSVPDGAPPAGSKPSDHKFDYLLTCAEVIDPLKKIVLAVDQDGPGKTLEEELARRLGPERCWRVAWPDGCKDANEVLMHHGAGALAACIHQAKPYPLQGVVTVEEVANDVWQLYQEGLPRGFGTGWQSVDQHYTVRPGEMTIVTGIPSHGKSQFLDALMVNLARDHGWSLGVCSPENLPVARHLVKLIELWTGSPFAEGARQRLSPVALEEALQWVHDHFVFVAPEDTVSIPILLQTATRLVTRYGIRGFVIDPWNEFDHSRPPGQSETEYISISLAQIRRFARNHGVHVWVVAHPLKLNRRDDGSYPVPAPYDISGSAHWRNKADNCLTVWRDMEDNDRPVTLHVQKIRFREVGKVGSVDLHWNPINGRYDEYEAS